uniref:Glycerol-3-phosphate acyltransferase 2, mitochondrial n=1 Tax=Chelonoidis abingdonii TaxID=106734 RepID=A0A8C0HEW3_CHEAB
PGLGETCFVSSLPQMKTWPLGFGVKLEIVTPFLGKYRPFVGRCCQTCTPKSWVRRGDWKKEEISLVCLSLSRYRGWLVRRLCYFLAIIEWKVDSDTPRDLQERIFCSKRYRSSCESNLRLFTLWAAFLSLSPRLCSWALLRLLNCMFLNVLLHKGQLEMVRRAAQTPDVPLVFLSTCKSQLDGLLLPFLLFSQGLGVPRVTWEYQNFTPTSFPWGKWIICLPFSVAWGWRGEGGMSFWLVVSGLPSTHFSFSSLLPPRQGVFLSRLMSDFSWLVEETLLRNCDVGFSGRLRDLVLHALSLLRGCVSLHHLSRGDVLVAPRETEVAVRELSWHSAALLPVFMCEAVGAEPCSNVDHSAPLRSSQAEPMHLFSPQISQLDNCPDFFLFLCGLLGPLLKTFERAAAFLVESGCPELGMTPPPPQCIHQCVFTELLPSLFPECANRSLALSSIRTFKELGVLKEQPGPAGPILHLSETFSTKENQERLEKFMGQFTSS